MAEKEEVVIDERPVFKVTQAGGFATGLKKYEPGELVVWEVPPGWNDKKYGKHFADYGPSVTFEPMNPPAQRLMDAHKIKVAEKNKPKPSSDELRANKLEDLITGLVKSNEQLQERFLAVLEKMGKK